MVNALEFTQAGTPLTTDKISVSAPIGNFDNTFVAEAYKVSPVT